MTWNFGDLFDGCGAVHDEQRPALIHGDRVLTWGELTRRSNNLAAGLQAQGAQPGDKVAIYLRNCPEYLETLVACFKARLVPVNVNYRYRDDELHYILDNSDAVAVVHGAEFDAHVAALRPRLPGVNWLQVGAAYEALVAEGDGQPLAISRSGDDMLFIYTGGTTGMPKAVMWRHEDLWFALRSGSTAPCNAGEMVATPQEHLDNLGAFDSLYHFLVACPLMHGSGLLTSIAALSGGATIVTLTGSGLDAEELWDAVQQRSINSMVIVGDAFARPMLTALDDTPERWDISSVDRIISSGVMWSQPVKEGLLRHNREMMLTDALGSSEGLGFGVSITTAKGTVGAARFVVGEDCKVFNEAHEEVVPGSEERGFIARPGPIPVGYYKDEKKTAETFPTIQGVRYSIPGDWCTVAADGTLKLLGRGSACINSGGEKIYPEEIEEILKTHQWVEDALVFGVADEQWGQAVTAVVALRTAQASTAASLHEVLRQHVRDHLADYKVPKAVLEVDVMFRAPNGKPDYKAAKAWVEANRVA